MRTAVLVVIGLVLLGCKAADPDGTVTTINPADYLPAGYPPKIGAVQASLNGTVRHWETYDYSVGALDAAAQISGLNGTVQFRLMGDPAGKPGSDSNRLAMKGTSAAKLQSGPLRDVLIEIVAGDDWNGARLSSAGQAAELVLDAVIDSVDGGYGHAKGHFTTVLCAVHGDPVQVDPLHCQPFSGTFDTDLQFDNL